MHRYTIIFLILITACSSGSVRGTDAGTDSGSTTDAAEHKPADSGTADAHAAFDAGIVGAYWGPAPDRETRLMIFDALWAELDRGYAGFVVMDSDWDEVRRRIRPQIAQAGGYGRFYALLSRMILDLHDIHTTMDSKKVCGTAPVLRPPVYIADDQGSIMGVCVTPVKENRLLVYRVEEENPAGLLPGDFILGYDNESWEQCLEKIEERQLPVCGYNYSSRTAFEYQRLASVVNNAHLFQTMQIQRRGSDRIESLDTDVLLDYETDILCADQIGIEGIDLPLENTTELWSDFWEGAGHTTWDLIPGKNIGMINVYSWVGMSLEDFTSAITELMDTDGIIIDQRFNMGGNPHQTGGLGILFEHYDDSILQTAYRDHDNDDRKAMMIETSEVTFEADADTFYDHPVAVLTGPKSISGGDYFPYLMATHPRVRRFGRCTNGSFASKVSFWNPDTELNDLYVSYTYRIGMNPDGEYLQGTDQYPEEEVWLEPADAAEGTDTVINTALEWIDSQNSESRMN